MARSHLPPWPLKREWPRRGETVAHAVCREWNLPCPCERCVAEHPQLPVEAEEAKRDA